LDLNLFKGGKSMKKRAILGALVLAVCALAFIGCAQQRPMTTKGLQRIHFDFDKYNIKSEWQPAIKANAAWLQGHPSTHVLVEGHCDERGSAEYNIALGDRRARSAKSYLVNLGIDPSRISTISYGKERPVCTEHNESCWWKNRRDEFVAK